MLLPVSAHPSGSLAQIALVCNEHLKLFRALDNRSKYVSCVPVVQNWWSCFFAEVLQSPTISPITSHWVMTQQYERIWAPVCRTRYSVQAQATLLMDKSTLRSRKMCSAVRLARCVHLSTRPVQRLSGFSALKAVLNLTKSHSAECVVLLLERRAPKPRVSAHVRIYSISQGRRVCRTPLALRIVSGCLPGFPKLSGVAREKDHGGRSRSPQERQGVRKTFCTAANWHDLLCDRHRRGMGLRDGQGIARGKMDKCDV